MICRRLRLLTLVALLAPSLVSAHAGDGNVHAGLVHGVLHPVTGIDHLLAMLAVGWWSAATQTPRWWAAPVAFTLATLAGALMGAVVSVAIPGVEWSIAGSVVVFGVLMLAAVRLPVIAAAAVAAGFGVFHGFAHGVELGGSDGVGAWILGMAAGTLLLHLVGAGAGRAATKHSRWITRTAGAVTTVLGVALLGGAL